MKEHIFTSSPAGLMPGSRGFATVAASRELSPPLMARLEKLSAYPFAFELGDPRFNLNPVGYSYVRLKLATQTLRVLSRRSAAGVDYSGRSNALAHHIVLESGERSEAGPAWLAFQPGFFVEQWEQDRVPHYIESDRIPPQGNEPSSVCHTWAQATGDAGWGGALIRNIKESPNRISYIIYKPDQDPLRLIRESLALLPPVQRWQIFFNTYATDDSVDIICQWRCVLAGTSSAKAALQNTHAAVLDLTQTMASPIEDDFTAAARQGIIYEPAKPTQIQNDLLKPAVTHSSSKPKKPANNWSKGQSIFDLNTDDEAQLNVVSTSDLILKPNPKPRAFRRWIYPWVAVAVAVVVIGLITVAGIFWWQFLSNHTSLSNTSPTKNRDTESLPSIRVQPDAETMDDQSSQIADNTLSDNDSISRDKIKSFNKRTDINPLTKQVDDSGENASLSASDRLVKDDANIDGIPEDIAAESTLVREDFKTIQIINHDKFSQNEVDYYQPVDLRRDLSILPGGKPLGEKIVFYPNERKGQPEVKIVNNQIVFSVSLKTLDSKDIATLSFETDGKATTIKWNPPGESHREKFANLRLVLADKNNPSKPWVFYLSQDAHKRVVVDMKIQHNTIRGYLSKLDSSVKTLFRGTGDEQNSSQRQALDGNLSPFRIAEFSDGQLDFDSSSGVFTIESSILTDYQKYTKDLSDWNRDFTNADDGGQKEAGRIRDEYNKLTTKVGGFKDKNSEPVNIYGTDKYDVTVVRIAVNMNAIELPALNSTLRSAAKKYDKEQIRLAEEQSKASKEKD